MAATRLRIVGKSENRATAGGDRPRVVEFEFMRYDDFKKIKLTTISPQEAEGKPVVHVYGVNSRYVFRLSDDAKGPLLVKTVATDDRTRKVIGELLVGVHLFDNPIRVGGVLLADFLSFPSIHWRVDPTPGGPLRFVGNGTVPSPLTPSGFPVASFDIAVDNSGWIVRQVLSMGEGHQVETTVTYSGGRPVSETSVGTGKGITYLDQLTTYETWDDQAPPHEADYTLSAFGLPEPYGVEWERPTPWWLYALISAGVLFVVAVIVSFWKRRLAARSAG
ncbi:MAG TPA: hypothetical protein PKC45_19325 [Gemmatales bacterium]|nr:hypothetical protein [Gemmatales bacterium]